MSHSVVLLGLLIPVGRRLLLDISHQRSLLFSSNALGVAAVGVTTAVEEGLAANEDAPQTNKESTDNHTNDADGYAGNNSDTNGEQNVVSKLVPQLAPAVLTELEVRLRGHARHLMSVVAAHTAHVMTAVATSVVAMSLAALATAHVTSHLAELVEHNSADLAEHVVAALGELLPKGNMHKGCGLSLVDLGDTEATAVTAVDEMNLDVRDTILETAHNLDNLQVNDDVGHLGLPRSGLALPSEGGTKSDWHGILEIKIVGVALLDLGGMLGNKIVVPRIGVWEELKVVCNEARVLPAVVDTKDKLEVAFDTGCELDLAPILR